MVAGGADPLQARPPAIGKPTAQGRNARRGD